MQRAIWWSGAENVGRIKPVIKIVDSCTTNRVWRALLSQSGKTGRSHVVHGRAKWSIYPLFLVFHHSCDKRGLGRSMGLCLARPGTACLQRAVCSLCPGWPWAALDHGVSSLQIHGGLITRRKGLLCKRQLLADPWLFCLYLLMPISQLCRDGSWLMWLVQGNKIRQVLSAG